MEFKTRLKGNHNTKMTTPSKSKIFYPLSPESAQRQFSPSNIYTLSRGTVIRKIN